MALKRQTRILLWFWGVTLGGVAALGIYLQTLPPTPHNHLTLALGMGAPAPAQIVPIADPDPALTEPAATLPGRAVPRIADDGRSADHLYAAVSPPPSNLPRIAIIIGGFGLAHDIGTTVLHDLPPSVDIALSAYAPPEEVNQLQAEARAQGRECLVSVPLEPPTYPRDQEGDHALLISADPHQNAQNLEWALSRHDGCFAATSLSDGFDGAGYLHNTSLARDLLQSIGGRGLAWLDARVNATLPDGIDALHQKYVADVFIDPPDRDGAPPAAERIGLALEALGDRARADGVAIAVLARPTPAAIDKLASFIDSLPVRGLTLVPLSALATARATVEKPHYFPPPDSSPITTP
jgi:polysaccharide deacetylase 2 family uncharacterized protein YibQ